MRIEFSVKEAMHDFVDLFPKRVYTYIDKSTNDRIDVNVGISRSQPRRAVGTAFRPFYETLVKAGYSRETIIQRFVETEGVWSNIVLLAQKGGRAAELGRFTFEFVGDRAHVAKYEPGQAQDTLSDLVSALGAQVVGNGPGA